MFTTLGHFTLNLSFFLYLIFYLPQLIHNLKKTHLQELSLLMHVILCIATIADLLYGFGREMQWQYRLVTIVSLVCLSIQHLQICYYRIVKNTSLLWLLTGGLSLALGLAIFSIYMHILSTEIAIGGGIVAQIGLFTFTIPQIIKNYRDQTTIGVSIYFVLFSVLLNLLDSISAWTLGWDYPSKIGSPAALLLSSFLLWQFKLYRARH